jgi:hypothetical protein
MGVITPSAAAALTMLLALISQVSITFLLQGYIYHNKQIGPQHVACVTATPVITFSCRFLYRKLSGEKDLDWVFKTMLTWIPTIVALWGLSWIHGELERKAGCSFR